MEDYPFAMRDLCAFLWEYVSKLSTYELKEVSDILKAPSAQGRQGLLVSGSSLGCHCSSCSQLQVVLTSHYQPRVDYYWLNVTRNQFIPSQPGVSLFFT